MVLIASIVSHTLPDVAGGSSVEGLAKRKGRQKMRDIPTRSEQRELSASKGDVPYEGPSFPRRFLPVPCPVCGAMFSKCGLPNHLRKHQRIAVRNTSKNSMNRRSPAWWDGWKQGYRLGARDGRNQARKEYEERIQSQRPVEDRPWSRGVSSFARGPKKRNDALTTCPTSG